MGQCVLVLNCGSSSIKFAIVDGESGKSVLTGLAENLGNDDSALSIKVNNDKTNISLPAKSSHTQALAIINDALKKYPEFEQQIIAIGHRVVHGGETFTQASLINDDVKSAIHLTSHMAPLHNPANLSGIESAQASFPELPHVAVFDTAFFQTMPDHAYLYALPYQMYKEHGIRRYGFHGTSHEFVSEKAAEALNKPLEQCNLITAHLGNGCSIAAIHQGKAVDTSLGFTPLEGLVMGTRCGDIDPSIPTYLEQTLSITGVEVNELLNKSSGLFGISGISNDCRALEEEAHKGNKQAKLALEIFCYRLAKYIGGYLVVAGPLDAFVFTGGIGENSSFVRRNTLKHLRHLNFAVNESLNTEMRFGKSGEIQASNQQTIMVIPTNEEWVIANKAIQLTQA